MLRPVTIFLIIILGLVVAVLVRVFDKDRVVVQKQASIPDLIQVDKPLPNSFIKSPVEVTGIARGTWYFEASFPIHIYDGNGSEIAVVPAQAQSDWMTENFVPFKATISFPLPSTADGKLVLRKDNPSGEAIYDRSLEIPVKFRP